MYPEYVIVQAGGKGTRMGKYTFNKPKALISVNGLPLILKIFKTFKNAFFVVITDYKHDVLHNYLLSFANNTKYTIVKTSSSGTCAGLKKALEYIPQNTSFVITWSDLYFSDEFTPNFEHGKNYVGISKTFKCRWSFKDGNFFEEPSFENGVAGFFLFTNKEHIADVPEEGEFVRYLSTKNIQFERFELNGVKEYGTVDEYEKLFSNAVSRPFNTVLIKDDYVEKVPIDEKGQELAVKERAWYKFVSERKFENIPKLLSLEPLRLSRILGNHPFEIEPDSKIVKNIINAMHNLHSIDSPIPANIFSLDKEYFTKTFERLWQVRNLIPYTDRKSIRVNGMECPNPFYYKDEILNLLREYYPKEFKVIHGDPTFSNTLVDDQKQVYFIDPRGYFGFTTIYGDEDYDFAKLYYSLVGNYDKFNRRKFKLKIKENEVELEIESSGYEKYEELFFEMIGPEKKEKIKLLHAIIWLSLTTYAWDDYDMICGAFFNGTLKLREVFEK
ncbi:MAG: NTP transferase domain-containing protein [Fervidobacterium sp.]|jgi:thiamine kinase-like enzyme